MAETWENWQIELLDDFILGYSPCETQEDLSYEVGKSLNAVKIKLGRRKMEIDTTKRLLTIQEYKIILSNRFDKTSEEVAELISSSKNFLCYEMEELDNLECKEFMEKDYANRLFTPDEAKVIHRLYHIKKRNAFQIAQIMNRPIGFIKEMIC